MHPVLEFKTNGKHLGIILVPWYYTVLCYRDDIESTKISHERINSILSTKKQTNYIKSNSCEHTFSGLLLASAIFAIGKAEVLEANTQCSGICCERRK